MTTELAMALVRLNISLGVAVLLVLILRTPIRRWCGADLAYRLWILIPITLIGDLTAGVLTFPHSSLGPPIPADWVLPVLPVWTTKIWLGGVAAGLLMMAGMHLYMSIRVRRGTAGPAVVGLFRPRLCLPVDFTSRFTPAEQKLIRTHERMHLERNDVLANAAMGLLRCLLWFNPLIHLAAIALKHDQEMACDAGVMDAFPDQRRRYASTMLKAQLGPMGVCAFGSHPLEARIAAVVRGEPLPYPRVFGAVFMGAGLFLLVWSYAYTFHGATPGEDLVAGLRHGNLVADLWAYLRTAAP